MHIDILSHEKKLIFVQVYEKLYEMINDGKTFPVGTKLPSEPKLANMLGVSRMTLRQALSLLREDGLITKIQGKGNFINDRNNPGPAGVEKIGNPVYKCNNININDIEIDFRLEIPNSLELDMFKKSTAVSVAVDRWYRSNDKIAAYTLSVMPIETISKFKIDLNHKDELKKFLEEGVYEATARAHLTAKITSVGDFISDKYQISTKSDIILITEYLYCDDDYAPVVCNKHYILPEYFYIEFNAIK